MSDILVRTGSLRFGYPQNRGLFRKASLREVIKGVDLAESMSEARPEPLKLAARVA